MTMELTNKYNNCTAQKITETSAAPFYYIQNKNAQNTAGNSRTRNDNTTDCKTRNYGTQNNRAQDNATENNITRNNRTADCQIAIDKTKNSKSESMESYVNKLAKLVPSVEFKVGYSFASAKSGKTLTVNPKLLEKMRNDPAKEKEMKELIGGVESMTKWSENLNKATGWKTVFRHSYIDENGNYCHIALIRNEYMLNLSDKLREERRKNSDKLIEKTKENAANKKEEIEQAIADKKNARSKAQELFEEKLADSKNGIIYIDHAQMQTLIEAAKEEESVRQTDIENAAAKISISQEGMESYRKECKGNDKSGVFEKIVEKKRVLINQSKYSTFNSSYKDALETEAETLKAQHSGSVYTLADKAQDYVKAYKTLYQEIVQGCQDGRRERYIEDNQSETGFRKMTMEEELQELDKAFCNIANRENAFVENAKRAAAAFQKMAEKLSKYQCKRPEKIADWVDTFKKLEAQGITTQENFGGQMLSQMQAWKDAYWDLFAPQRRWH